MSVHLKEVAESNEPIGYKPALCGLRDYGQLRYAVFNPENKDNMALVEKRIAADKDDLSIGFCWACRGAFLQQFASAASGEREATPEGLLPDLT
jgi:hypothetical protein